MLFSKFEPLVDENLENSMNPFLKLSNGDTLDVMDEPHDNPIGGKGSEIRTTRNVAQGRRIKL